MYNHLHSAAGNNSTMSSIAAISKICKNCGRVITWRKKWEACWNEIVYCSATCRKPLSALDHAFESRLLSMLTERRFDAVHGLKKGGASLAEVNCEDVEASVLATWSLGGDLLGDDEVSDSEEDLEGDSSVTETASKSSSSPSAVSSVDATLPVDPSARKVPKGTRERCRRAARRLVDLNVVEIWQHGKVLDPSFAKGRIYLRGKPGLATDLVEERKRIEKLLVGGLGVEEEDGKRKKGKNPKYTEKQWEAEEVPEEEGGRKVKGKGGKKR